MVQGDALKYFAPYETRLETYHYDEDFEFDYIQVNNMRDKDLEDKINNLLVENAYGWIEYYRTGNMWEKKLFLTSYEPKPPEIMYQSGKYLSVRYPFSLVEPIQGVFCPMYYNCITIDMRTGERVVLKDLLKINEDLVVALKQPGAVQFPVNNYMSSIKETKEEFLKAEKEEVLQYLLDLSEEDTMTEKEAITDGNYISAISMVYKKGYNLTSQGIAIYGMFGGQYLVLNRGPINDYLYFDPWKNSPMFMPPGRKEKKGYSMAITQTEEVGGEQRDYVQVEKMENAKLQEKINQLLKEDAYEWKEETTLSGFRQERPKITFQTGDYLSIQYIFRGSGSDGASANTQIHRSITIDMNTGEELSLNDLLHINDGLGAALKDPKATRFISPQRGSSFSGSLAHMVKEDRIKEQLEKVGEEGGYNMTPDGIQIDNYYLGSAFVIQVGQIKGFLKIDPWQYSYDIVEEPTNDYVQIGNAKDPLLKDLANQQFREAAIEWGQQRHNGLGWPLIEYVPQDPEITYQSERFLSVRYMFIPEKGGQFNKERVEVNESVTVDLTTGEAVPLKDLVSDGEALSTIFQTSSRIEGQGWKDKGGIPEPQDIHPKDRLENYNVTPEGILFYFKGGIQLVVGKEELKGIIKKNIWN